MNKRQISETLLKAQEALIPTEETQAEPYWVLADAKKQAGILYSIPPTNNSFRLIPLFESHDDAKTYHGKLSKHEKEAFIIGGLTKMGMIAHLIFAQGRDVEFVKITYGDKGHPLEERITQNEMRQKFPQ